MESQPTVVFEIQNSRFKKQIIFMFSKYFATLENRSYLALGKAITRSHILESYEEADIFSLRLVNQSVHLRFYKFELSVRRLSANRWHITHHFLQPPPGPTQARPDISLRAR